MSFAKIVGVLLCALLGFFLGAIIEISLFLFVWGDNMPNDVVNVFLAMQKLPMQLLLAAIFGSIGYFVAKKFSRK